MTGIFFYKTKQDTRLPDNLLKHARRVKHRGQYRAWLLDAEGCFAAVFLNKPQQHNLLVADGTEEEMASVFSVLDGYIEVRVPPSLENGVDLAHRPTQLELAREMYKNCGSSAFSHINGPFSVFFKDNEEIVVARDSIGSNPIYIQDDPEKLVIASEYKAFKGLGNSPRLLEPGSMFWTNGRESRVQVFQDPLVLFNGNPARSDMDVNQAITRLQASFDIAVRRSIPRDAKVAALLSGGLDSSVVCAVALKYINQLDAYVASYGNSEDLIRARQFAARYHDQVKLHVVEYTIDEMLRAVPDVIRGLETFDAALVRSAIPMHVACANMPSGVDVLLTGEGADELFAGYAYLESVAPGELNKELLHLLEVEHATGLQRVDRIPYQFGIEARAPWFDADLAKLAFSFPAHMKLKRERDLVIEKWIVRQSFKHLLPDEIAWRKKAKFSQGAGSELVLRDYLNEKISDEEFARESEIAPGVFARSKEELYYWQVFEEYFEPSSNFIKSMPRTEQFSI